MSARYVPMPPSPFSTKGLTRILAGPVLCLALCTLLWWATLSRLADDHRSLETNALKSVASLSGAYAQFLSRTLEQMDQIAMQVTYDWRREKGKFDLRAFRREGLLIAPHLITVSILGPDGYPTTSTVNLTTRPSAASREYFIYHRDNDSPAARVGMPVVWPGTGKARLPFTRRLNQPDGSFGGVVAVSIGASYFSEFYDDVSLGNDGVVAMLDMDGAARTARVGDALHTQTTPVLREAMLFGSMEGSMRLDDGRMFTDGKHRYVGWHKLADYPFIAMVGVSEAEVMSSYRSTERAYRSFAWIGTLVLLSFGAASALMTARLSARTLQMEAVRRTYRLATEGANEGFYMLRPVRGNGAIVDFDIIDCNERGAAMYRCLRERLLGSRLSMLHPAEDFSALLSDAAGAEERGFQEAEVALPPQNRLLALWLYRRLAATDAGLAMTVRDISESKLHQQQLLRMANHDSLTGLPNRQWLNEALPAAIERARERGGMLGLLFIDLDKFKQVNDSAGHHVGDELLRISAQRMQAALRPGDHVVRLGGDEFTVIMESLGGEEDARQLARRIGQSLSEPFVIQGAQFSIGASTGITLYPRDAQDADKLLHNADLAMYAAKSEGSGGERLYQSRMQASGVKKAVVARKMPEAFNADLLFLRLQPRLDLESGELKALEAQFWLNDPWRGAVGIAEMLEGNDDSAKLCEVFGTAFDMACERLAHWKNMGLTPIPLALSMPLSCLCREEMHDRMSACLLRHGVHPGWLELGIAEASQLPDEAGLAQLQRFVDLGLRLSVCDVGSAPIPLWQLQRLPVQAIGLRMLAQHDGHDQRSSAQLMSAVMSMARQLGLGFVVTGVDSEAKLEQLRGLGHIQVQGAALHPALLPEEIAHLLKHRQLLRAMSQAGEELQEPRA